MMRPCSGCGERKPAGAFTWHAYTTTQGKLSRRRDSRCLECRRFARMLRYWQAPERDRAAAQEWRAANREHIKTYNRAYRLARPEMKREAQARRRGKRCECCTVAEIREIYRHACLARLEVDHVLPLFKGGKHCLYNLQLLTSAEHKAKTKTDLARG